MKTKFKKKKMLNHDLGKNTRGKIMKKHSKKMTRD
jgi:hypothetical protein